MIDHHIESVRRIRASAHELFKAWTDPIELAQWWCREGQGWKFASAEIDLRTGGSFRLAMHGPMGRTHVATGQYREINCPERLVFTWDWEHLEDRMGKTLVTVTLTAIEPQVTDIRIVHEGFSSQGRGSGHGQGWAELINRLKFLKEKTHDDA